MGLFSALGAGLGLAGSLFSSNKQEKAAKRAAQMAQFNPWDVQGAFGGGVNFDRKTNAVNMTASPEQQAMYNQLGGMASGFLGGQGFGQPFVDYANTGIAGQMPGLFNQSQMASMQMPTGAANSFMGGSGMREAMAMQGAGGFLGEAMGSPAMFGVQDPYTMQALNQGFRDYNTPGAGSYQDVYDQRLGMLRDAAAPFEQRAFNNLNQNLFDTGRLESSGGGLQTEAFARGLGQADTQRSLDAMGFAEGLWQRDMNNVLQQRQLGANMVGTGFGGMSAGTNANLMNRQLAGYLGSNLMGQAQNFGQDTFNTAAGMSDLVNSRAMQRLSTAQNLLGFGGTMQQQNFNTGLGFLGSQQNIDNQIRNLATMGGNFGTQQAQAGANAGQFGIQAAQNNFGNALAGFGMGMFDYGMSRPQVQPTPLPAIPSMSSPDFSTGGMFDSLKGTWTNASSGGWGG